MKSPNEQDCLDWLSFSLQVFYISNNGCDKCFAVGCVPVVINSCWSSVSRTKSGHEWPTTWSRRGSSWQQCTLWRDSNERAGSVCGFWLVSFLLWAGPLLSVISWKFEIQKQRLLAGCDTYRLSETYESLQNNWYFPKLTQWSASQSEKTLTAGKETAELIIHHH